MPPGVAVSGRPPAKRFGRTLGQSALAIRVHVHAKACPIGSSSLSERSATLLVRAAQAGVRMIVTSGGEPDARQPGEGMCDSCGCER